jgi:methylglutaconyl-CoA hydratase
VSAQVEALASIESFATPIRSFVSIIGQEPFNMPEAFVWAEIQNGVARLVLNRPQKRNALSRDFIHQLYAAVVHAASHAEVRLLILAAEGPVFCAGMDLGEMEERAKSPEARQEWQEDTRVYRDLLVTLVELPIPTLAVVQGPALAGGLGLVLACDLVLAAENAFIGLPEPQRGISAAVVTPLLIHRLGPGPATYLLLSGEHASAAEAHRFGLYHHVTPLAELPQREQELTAAVLTGSPAALATTKRHILQTAGRSLIADIDAGMQISAEARETPDAREGLAAFLEKRKPSWHPGTQ